MEPVVGIFPSRSAAEAAARSLIAGGFPEDRVHRLLAGELEAEEVPSEGGEQPGVGRAVGGVVGGTVGATAGLGLGAAAASLLIPGIGAVTAVGLAGAALLGALGVLGGAAAGGALDELSRHGIPRDELYLYEDALAHGKGIVLVTPEDDDAEAAARRALDAAGAETLDAARERWWIGIRDAEKAHYGEGAHPPFETAEDTYRRGVLAALHPDLRGRSAEEAAEALRDRLGPVCDDPAFRRGYDRGAARARERAAELDGASKR